MRVDVNAPVGGVTTVPLVAIGAPPVRPTTVAVSLSEVTLEWRLNTLALSANSRGWKRSDPFPSPRV